MSRTSHGRPVGIDGLGRAAAVLERIAELHPGLDHSRIPCEHVVEHRSRSGHVAVQRQARGALKLLDVGDAIGRVDGHDLRFGGPGNVAEGAQLRSLFRINRSGPCLGGGKAVETIAIRRHFAAVRRRQIAFLRGVVGDVEELGARRVNELAIVVRDPLELAPAEVQPGIEALAVDGPIETSLF